MLDEAQLDIRRKLGLKCSNPEQAQDQLPDMLKPLPKLRLYVVTVDLQNEAALCQATIDSRSASASKNIVCKGPFAHSFPSGLSRAGYENSAQHTACEPLIVDPPRGHKSQQIPTIWANRVRF